MSLLDMFKKKNPIIPRKSYAEIIPTLKINDDDIALVEMIVKKYYLNESRYETVSRITGVPSDVIFAIHYRESSLRFAGVLHNGELIIGTGKKTKLVPKGRGPFESWEESVIDALEIEKEKFPIVWNTAGKLEFLEKYNGLGYRKKGLSSPYVFSFTNEYVSGKYVADGKFDPYFVDKQCGCAAIILTIGNAPLGMG